MKFLVDLWLDGYDSPEEMEEACIEFIEEQLNFSGSSVKVSRLNAPKMKCSVCGTTENVRWVGGYQPYLCNSPECIPF